MDVVEPSLGIIERVSRFILLTTRGVATLVQSAYEVVVFRIRELSPGGKVRLRFLVYLSIILSLNYLSTIGMTSSPELLEFLRYNTSVSKISLTYIAGYLFITYVSRRLSPFLTHVSIVVLPSMFICLLDEEILWKTYRITFCSFLFLTYVSSIVPRQDSITSIGPITVIVSMTSMYASMLLYLIPIFSSWQCTVCEGSWYFGIMLASSGLIVDDLQVVMGSSGFPVGLVKKRARKYAYVIFAYYLVLFYSIAKLLALNFEAMPSSFYETLSK
ncbi:uncharacterized protein [Halyomorpha halys]|uniref:uncharacterized protein n=1 Tax=Halyomorpha halys TaxID=286706 RepID=UPI0006D515FF|nr:uncharacterized protein LOC106682893 [Halyomorpha halys]